MGGAGADGDFLQEFQCLCVEQVNGRTTAKGYPDPPTGMDHVAHVAAGVAVGLKPLWESVMVRFRLKITQSKWSKYWLSEGESDRLAHWSSLEKTSKHLKI